MVVSFCIHTSNIWEFKFHILINTYCQLAMWENVKCYHFSVHFPNDPWYKAFILMLIGHLCIFLCEVYVQIFSPFLIGLFILLLSSKIVKLYSRSKFFVKYIYIYDIGIFVQCLTCLFVLLFSFKGQSLLFWWNLIYSFLSFMISVFLSCLRNTCLSHDSMIMCVKNT